MCGIVGGVKNTDITPLLLDGLNRLEYRGYDSSGLVVLSKDNKLDRQRAIGKVFNLENKLKTNKVKGKIGLAHTRWATHGGPSNKNAHPHISKNSISVVHNGIIENYIDLKALQIEQGYEFSSDTDTEVIAHEALLHVEAFDSIIDVVLEPGDILYIPPGYPHEGIALEPSMSFSVGFRANSTVSLLSGLADHLIDNELGAELLEDVDRQAVTHSGEITNTDYQNIKSQLQNLLENEQVFKKFVGNFLTNAKHELDLIVSKLIDY